MRVLIGVGAVAEQDLPFAVLKYSIDKLSGESQHSYTVEKISAWPSYERLSATRTDYGTVFSLQRFLVASEACARNFDAFMHLDSDMLVLKRLDGLIDLALKNASAIVVPEPNRQFNQPLQTAVLAGAASDQNRIFFETALVDFQHGDIEYADLMRLNFCSANKILAPSAYNSREVIDDHTVVFHMTDLLRQPWVSPFNRYASVWLSYLNNALADGSIDLGEVKAGIESGIYRPGMMSRLVLRDLIFIPPQYRAYRSRLTGSRLVQILAKFDVTWALSIHAKGLYRRLIDYKGV